MATQKVLVLADQEAVLAAIGASIGGTGWEVTTTDTLAKLLHQLTLHRPTALLLDARLLSPDPSQALERIGLAFTPSRIPLILLNDPTEVECPSPLVTGSIAWPLDGRQLAQRFAQLVEEDRFQFQFANLTDLGGEELLVEMIDLFQEQAPQKLQEVRTALANGDLRTVNRATHSLKSSAANLGAEQLRMLAARVEALSAQAADGEIPALLEEMDQAYRLVHARLEQRRAGPG